MCEFVHLVKLAQQESYGGHCDLFPIFEDPCFDDFNFIEALTNENVPITWFLNLNGGGDVAYFTFSFVEHKYHIYKSTIDNLIVLQPIAKAICNQAISKVKTNVKGQLRAFLLSLNLAS